MTEATETVDARDAARRVRAMRKELHDSYIGLAAVVDWLLAALIARENALLLGPPGVAKTEIAIRVFELLGLGRAKEYRESADARSDDLHAWWDQRFEQETRNQKYFHYLLSRFTQPEELFGPIEIEALRKGDLVRINFGLLTGPGVRAVFLDEVFKASSSILNTLLTLTQERQYFNWGGMVSSDIVMFIGAANELPSGLGAAGYGLGSGTEDFHTLYAFLDRFPVRLLVPIMSGTSTHNPAESDLSKATEMAIKRESLRFVQSAAFSPRDPETMPSIDDMLRLGSYCLRQDAGRPGGPFREQDLKKFKQAFIEVAAALQLSSTNAQSGAITWTISPRKLKAVYKVALAHALVCDDSFADGGPVVSNLGSDDLHVFDLIWDAPAAQHDLEHQSRSAIKRFYRS